MNTEFIRDPSMNPGDKMYFSHEQVRWLKQQFPARVLPVTATEAQMRDYFGEQRVVSVIASRTR